MASLIELQPAFLLHSRPFRDSSLILDFLTPDFGRISAISRGARSAGSKNKSLLQPFTPVYISLSGKSDLKSLRSIELRQTIIPLQGERLFSAMYMNEIIVRLFQSHEADPAFFDGYEQSLNRLSGTDDFEPVLREFELMLLDTLGYGIDFSAEAHTHQPVMEGEWYYFQPESGFGRVLDKGAIMPESDTHRAYRGEDLLSIQQHDFKAPETRKTAKQVLRIILSMHLGPTPLRSRNLFRRR